MTVTNEIKEATEKEEIQDDVFTVKEEEPKEDDEKLLALKAKLAKKGGKMPPRIVQEKKRSLNFGVLCSGQGGSKLGQAFHQLGYKTLIINTTNQDLQFINVPDSNKILLEYGIGGSAKDRSVGRTAAELNQDKIFEQISLQFEDCPIIFICSSLGGGSGSGSLDVLVDLCNKTGKPVIVCGILPLSSDDAQCKRNSLEALASLTKDIQNKKIANLIVIDNAKLEAIYSDVNQLDFFDVSNKKIIEVLEVFNTYSSMPSSVKPLDPMEFSKLILNGGGLSIYGSQEVYNYQEDETAIAEAAIDSDSCMLGSGFNISEAAFVGVLFLANKNVWAKIPSSAINYAISIINEQCSGAESVFRGIYSTDDPEDCVKIYTFYSGLNLPNSRIEQLKSESAELDKKIKEKQTARNLSLKLEFNKDESITAAEKIREKIAKKRSPLEQMMAATIDKRKK